APHFAHRFHVVRGELADVSFSARHLEEAAVRRGAARSVRVLDLPAAHLHARLAQWSHERAARREVAHRLPVVAALRARTRIDPLPRRLLENVGAILRRAALGIDRLEDVLEDRLLVAEELSVSSIELPQNPRFADREDDLLIADVDE